MLKQQAVGGTDSGSTNRQREGNKKAIQHPTSDRCVQFQNRFCGLSISLTSFCAENLLHGFSFSVGSPITGLGSGHGLGRAQRWPP